MKSSISTILLAALSFNAAAELVPLAEQSLEAITAQSNGLTIDIDASSLAFTYSYQNAQNPNESSWVTGANAGSGGDYVNADLDGSGTIACNASNVGAECIGSGAGLVEFKAMTVDIGQLPGSTEQSIVIGLPEEIRLNRVNTGDYYIVADTAGVNTETPPVQADVVNGRKLIGLKWNTPPPLNFADQPNSGQVEVNGMTFDQVRTHNFSSNPIRMDGQIHIFAN